LSSAPGCRQNYNNQGKLFEYLYFLRATGTVLQAFWPTQSREIPTRLAPTRIPADLKHAGNTLFLFTKQVQTVNPELRILPQNPLSEAEEVAG
jgi:hypothetical protein